MCRAASCVVGRGCLLWPVCSLGQTLLAFALLHFVLQVFVLQLSLDFLLLHSSPLSWKGHLFLMLVLEGFVGHHSTVQHLLLQHYWSRHRLGLLWYWMVCLGNEHRSFCCFWDCTQVLHFKNGQRTWIDISVKKSGPFPGSSVVKTHALMQRTQDLISGLGTKILHGAPCIPPSKKSYSWQTIMWKSAQHY